MKPKMLASEAAEYLDISLPALHKRLKTKGLPYEKLKNKLWFGHGTSKELFNLDFTQTCISWLNLKGGVGKTHLSFAVAVRLSLFGAKVLVIDLDQQANMTQACQYDSEETPILVDAITDGIPIEDTIVSILPGLDLIPSRIDNAMIDNVIMLNSLPIDQVLKKRLQKLKKVYDYILIDCPPSTGGAVSAAMLASDLVIIPVDPEQFSMRGLKLTLEEIKARAEVYDIDISNLYRILLNKYHSRTKISHEVLLQLFGEYGDHTFRTFIRSSQDFANSINQGKTVFDKMSSSTSREDIDALTVEILDLTTNSQGVDSSNKVSEEA